MLVLKNQTIFFADTTVNIDPTAEELAEIAILAADKVRDSFDIEPRVAMLSFSQLRVSTDASARREGAEGGGARPRERRPELDDRRRDAGRHGRGARDRSRRSTRSARSQGGANVLIFPDLESANIAYKLLARLGGARRSGRSCWVSASRSTSCVPGNDVNDIVNMTAMAVVEAQQGATAIASTGA